MQGDIGSFICRFCVRAARSFDRNRCIHSALLMPLADSMALDGKTPSVDGTSALLLGIQSARQALLAVQASNPCRTRGPAVQLRSEDDLSIRGWGADGRLVHSTALCWRCWRSVMLEGI